MEVRRNLESTILKSLGFFSVIVLVGGRQCGKTTLSRLVRPEFEYFDLENINDFDLITQDMELFFREHPENLIIDEAQKSPELFEQLRGVVDKYPQKKGRFILTGSSHFELTQKISESLAGRVSVIEVPPLKQNEVQKKPVSIFFDQVLSEQDIDTFKSLKTMSETFNAKKILLEGGYPEPALKKNKEFSNLWMQNYFDTYLNRDMRTLHPKLDLLSYKKFISNLAFLSGTIINQSDIARKIEISQPTARDYIRLVEGSFFWRSLPSFKSSQYKHTIKMPKGYLRDSGLSLYLQKIQTKEQLDVYPQLGTLFEGFVIEEIIRGFQSQTTEKVDFFHFRTKTGDEVDLIIEGSFGIMPIEIKYGSHTKPDQVKALTRFIEKHQIKFGIVINNCLKPQKIADKIIQIPAACL